MWEGKKEGIVDAQLPILGARGSCTSGATHPMLSPSLEGKTVPSDSYLHSGQFRFIPGMKPILFLLRKGNSPVATSAGGL